MPYFFPFTVVCFDAKIGFDDNAKFRQQKIFDQEDDSESDPREVQATKYNLNYIGMDGNIGCMGKTSILISSINIVQVLAYTISTQSVHPIIGES